MLFCFVKQVNLGLVCRAWGQAGGEAHLLQVVNILHVVHQDDINVVEPEAFQRL